MDLTETNIKELDIDREARYLFWTIVEAVKDYIFFTPKDTRRNYNHYRLAKSWITNPQFIAQWGNTEDALCFTFGEALEMIGVQPENVNVFRNMITKARKADTQEERSHIVKSAYSELHFHDNEPDPFGWMSYHPLSMSLRPEEVN